MSIKRLKQWIKEDRIVRGHYRGWRVVDDNTTIEIGCAYYALTESDICNEGYERYRMPYWLAVYIPAWNDKVDDLPAFLNRLAKCASLWRNLDHAAWERVNAKVLSYYRKKPHAREPQAQAQANAAFDQIEIEAAAAKARRAIKPPPIAAEIEDRLVEIAPSRNRKDNPMSAIGLMG